MIVSLVGPDGAGKSTVSRLATERLSAGGVRIERVDRWDIVDNPAYPATRFMKPDVPDTRLCVAEMPGTTRFLFLMWSISHALMGRVPPTEQAGTVTLLDGYWMKHAASEIVYGLDRSWAEGVVSALPQSGRALYLRLEPKRAWERKAGKDVVPYECGMDPDCAQVSFESHQGRILEVLDDWAERFGWLTIEADAPLDDVVRRVVSEISGPAAAAER
ncbi:thymidylate kinase [Streptomyces sp. SBT349]|uniref:thymidylate kinase n=1 Tax=Streptomyces sp. SBT349 TaxID=1580539 RepID=UPI00066E9012|nr:thymidylate kinase [Streptomyces sp. SBT349]